MTGNTEEITALLDTQLQKHDVEILKKNILYERIEPEELKSCAAILFGTYTCGDGELPFETEDFADSLTATYLRDKAIGLFGSSARSYDQFCGSVDETVKRFTDLSAHVLEPIVKVDLPDILEASVLHTHRFRLCDTLKLACHRRSAD